MTQVMVSLLVLLLLVPAAQQQEECEGNSCNPQLGDLMVGRAAQLSATSTCGLDGPQKYCIIGYLEEEQKCFECDSRQPYNSYNNPESHRIENVITIFDPERKMKWWQSENGVHQVSIQLNLETLFQFSHLVLTFKSFRPAAMLVERSKDYGRTWKVFRYFAEDCATHFPGVSVQHADSVDDVVCDSRYSGSEPSTDGEVVLKALDPTFEIDNPYAPHIQELITMTNIRVNFTRLFTLGDTLLGRKRRNPEDKYYYALYEMVVRGSCFCNGHASQCMPVGNSRGDVFNEPGMVHGRCVCHHNTEGDNCERCQDFHNDAPWRPASENNLGICRRCNCHGHSSQCYFDPARYEATGRVSGGVCENCQHDRVGPQCEQCRPYLYQDPQRSLEDPHGCIPCDCDPMGSEGSGLCDPVTGQCVCKQHVEGIRCDRCKYGFFGLTQEDPLGCQMCRCNLLGTRTCDQETGECVCDQLAIGPYCDQCMPGYWGLGNTLYRCLPCDCDIGGALSTMCSPDNGQCQCLPNMIGRTCAEPAPGHFLPFLDYFLYEAENAAPLKSENSASLLKPTILPQCEKYYREQGYDLKYSNGRIVLVRRTKRQARRKRQLQTIPLDPGSALQIVPRQRTEGRPVTWTGPGFVRVLDEAGLRFTVENIPTSLDYRLSIRYEPESPGDWVASVNVLPLSPGDGRCPRDPTGTHTVTLAGNARGAVLDTPLCLNAGGRYFVDITFKKQPDPNPVSSSHILVDSMGLIPQIESVQDFCSQSDLDSFRRFRCLGLAAELGQEEALPEVCAGLIGSMSARINNGAVPCRCNAQGSRSTSCSKLGGICDCKPNVIGRCCDTCAPQTFGFGPDGCTPCDCDPSGSVSELCDQVRGQCPCRKEVSGRRCDKCQPGYWGFPLCRPCECNGLAELCDQNTGACLECKQHSTGHNCERCVEGYYGDPASRDPCEPCLCPETQASGRFFARSCTKERTGESSSMTCNCLNGHTGSSCDSCAPGFYGDLTQPEAHCEECPCNNNIDPDDLSACDRVTGQCLRCLYNTYGPRCQNCKPGYYGDALAQDCKECSCDRRGTEVTQCPLGSPCFCNPITGQCPCRIGVLGVLCDECDDGYWNIQGASGCQPCKCDPVNSLNNICDKVTGQCQCQPEFGGRHCDECGENHFGNPDLQCISCDCNMEGTERPACDPDTGECLCRTGVTGIFCDECAPGYESTFPACAPCHPCASLWAENVTDVQRAAERMQTFVPCYGDEVQPGYTRRWQRVLEKQAELDWLVNLTGKSLPRVEKVEKLCKEVRKLKDSIDPNLIVVDPTSLVDTEINNVRRSFNKLLDNLKDKITDEPEVDPEELDEALDEIKKLHRDFMADEKKVRNAKKALEDSMDTRQAVKEKLASCSNKGDMGPLEKKVKALSVAQLNEDICGAPSHEECSNSECGGALCRDTLGQRECGGPTCKGIVPVSHNATETAEHVQDNIIDLLEELKDAKIKIDDVKQMTLKTKDLADELEDRIMEKKAKVEKEKSETKELIKRVKDYLLDELVSPEDIEKMARAVLAINLPGSPDDIRSMINNIKDLLSNMPDFKKDLKNLEDQAKAAEDLLQRAQELKDRSKNIDVTEIKKDIYDAEKAQDKANNDLEDASDSKDMAKNQIKNVKEKLNDSEKNLNNTQPKDIMDDIKALKVKTAMNEEQAKEAKAAADTALANATDAKNEFAGVKNLFEILKDQITNQTDQNEAHERLKNITEEGEKLKKEVGDKLKQIEELEKKIHAFIKEKEDRAKEIGELLKMVEDLRKEIDQRATNYVSCTS